MKTIVYICATCQHHNQMYLGTPGFEWAEAKIGDSLTMAMEHVKENHEVRTEIRDEDEDD